MKRVGCLVLIALIFASYLYGKYVPSSLERNIADRTETCRSELSIDCLVDLGLYVLGEESDISFALREISWLAEMGRYEDAIALNEQALGSPSYRSISDDLFDSDRRFASFRLADALFEGQSLEQALASSSEWKAGDIWIAMMKISGQGNTSGLQRVASPLSDNQIREIVSQAVDLMLRFEIDGEEGLRGYRLVDVAELAAWLGDRERTLEALLRLPEETRVPYVISQDVYTIVGAETVMVLLENVSELDHYDFLRAGEAEENPQAAEAYLRQAFAMVVGERFISSDQTNRIFLVAVHKGYEALALEFAREITRLGFFTIDSNAHIGISALITAGAPREEINEAIAHVIDRLPDTDATYNVYARSFPSTGRAFFAVQLARIGEYERAAELLEGVRGPFHSWQILVSPHYGLEPLSYFLEQADRRLDQHEMLDLKAQAVRHVATHDDISDELRAWALDTAWEISSIERIDYDREFEIREMILAYAIDTNNGELETMALVRLAHAALNEPTSSQLIRAALEWHVSANLP